MSVHPDLLHELQTLEENLLRPDLRKNAAWLESVLAEGFREYGSSGHVYTREAMLAEFASETPTELSLSNFEVTPLAHDCVLATYRSRRVLADGTARTALRSSVWVRHEGGWQILFHQGTVESQR